MQEGLGPPVFLYGCGATGKIPRYDEFHPCFCTKFPGNFSTNSTSPPRRPHRFARAYRVSRRPPCGAAPRGVGEGN